MTKASLAMTGGSRLGPSGLARRIWGGGMGRSRIFAGPLNMQLFGTFVERNSGPENDRLKRRNDEI